ncbi:MAG TPA: hypothetical protein ENI86_12150 [Acidimicrobiales bacterium]|nr:hypothetical protein [Acidimicrobiales bacterium]
MTLPPSRGPPPFPDRHPPATPAAAAPVPAPLTPIRDRDASRIRVVTRNVRGHVRTVPRRRR